MHIECVKNNGVAYLRIAEGRYVKELGRQKKVIIKNLGPLSKFDDGKPDFLKRLRTQFKNGEIEFDGISNTKKIANQYSFQISTLQGVLNNQIKLKNIGSIILNKFYTELGINNVLAKAKSNSKIKYDLDGLTKLLVFGRILDPKSKKATYADKDLYYFPVTTSEQLKDIYKTLDILNKQSEKIQTRMNTKISESTVGRDTTTMFYDVTNYYFETMYGDDDIYECDENGEILLDLRGKPIIIEKGLRKKGVSKEKRSEPIVQMGLFIDQNGIPISYKLYPGNTQDKTTLYDMLENSKPIQKDGKIIVIADNGINTQQNLYALVDNGNGYIVSKSVKRSWKELKPWAEDENGYTYTNSGKFKYKSRIIEKVVKDYDGKTKKIKQKQVLYWSQKHYNRELHQNSKFIEYLESCRENPDKLRDKQRKSQEFIKVIQTDKQTGEVLKTKPVVVLLEEKIKKYKETMGYYSIITSEIDLDDKEIINHYHGLSRIEDSFRVIKSDLEGRPVHVWTKEHINAHFLICFIALTIIRLIQYKIVEKTNVSNQKSNKGWCQGITPKRITKALSNYKVCTDHNGICLTTEISKDLDTILNSVEFNYQFTEPTLKELNKLKNNYNKNFKL